MPTRKPSRREEEEERERERELGPSGPAPVAPTPPTRNDPQQSVSFSELAPTDATSSETQTDRAPVTTTSLAEGDQRKREMEGGQLAGSANQSSALSNAPTGSQNQTTPASSPSHGLPGAPVTQTSAGGDTAEQPSLTTSQGTNGNGELGRRPPPPPLHAGRPQLQQKDDLSRKLSTLSELNTATGRQENAQDDRLTRLQSIAENVKQMIKARMGTENPLEVESRTDVKRFVKVAQTRHGEKLVINTDVYIPGRWFRRRQWRPLDQNEEDEFFLKSAGTQINKK